MSWLKIAVKIPDSPGGAKVKLKIEIETSGKILKPPIPNVLESGPDSPPAAGQSSGNNIVTEIPVQIVQQGPAWRIFPPWLKFRQLNVKNMPE